MNQEELFRTYEAHLNAIHILDDAYYVKPEPNRR